MLVEFKENWCIDSMNRVQFDPHIEENELSSSH